MILGDIGVVDECWMLDIDVTEDDVAWCDRLMLVLLLIGSRMLMRQGYITKVDGDDGCQWIMKVFDDGC